MHLCGRCSGWAAPSRRGPSSCWMRWRRSSPTSACSCPTSRCPGAQLGWRTGTCRPLLCSLALVLPRLTLPHPPLLPPPQWHLQAHRKRGEREAEWLASSAAGQGPVRWLGRLEESFQREVQAQGGLDAAKPKAVWEALVQQGFAMLTLQVREATARAARSEAGPCVAGSRVWSECV